MSWRPATANCASRMRASNRLFYPGVVSSSMPGQRFQPVDPDVPGRLACWLAAAMAGPVDDARAVAAVEADSDGHIVAGLGSLGSEVTLSEAWPLLRASGAGQLAVILPAPGDALSAAGTGPFARAALDAGGGVLLETAGQRLGLVPRLDLRGSSYRGFYWIAFEESTFLDDAHDGDAAHDRTGGRPITTGLPVTTGLPAVPTDLPAATVPRLLEQADRALRRAIRAATDTLAGIDLAHWRPELAGSSAAADLALRTAHNRLPPNWPAPSRVLIERALGLWRVVQLATTTPGAASTSANAMRDQVLRELSRTLRESLMVAYNAPIHLLISGAVEHEVRELR